MVLRMKAAQSDNLEDTIALVHHYEKYIADKRAQPLAVFLDFQDCGESSIPQGFCLWRDGSTTW